MTPDNTYLQSSPSIVADSQGPDALHDVERGVASHAVRFAALRHPSYVTQAEAEEGRRVAGRGATPPSPDDSEEPVREKSTWRGTARD